LGIRPEQVNPGFQLMLTASEFRVDPSGNLKFAITLGMRELGSRTDETGAKNR
jgi:hypothetical protein